MRKETWKQIVQIVITSDEKGNMETDCADRDYDSDCD